MRRALRCLAPPPNLKTSEWAERYRYIAKGPLPGKFSFRLTPFLRAPCEAFDDPTVHTIAGIKPSQIGWTDIVIGNIIGKIVHQQPQDVIMLFPREQSAKDWSADKFNPMVMATPVLRSRVEVKVKSKDQTQTRKNLPGGFILKLVGANSPDNLKGFTARVQIVEEPDDCTTSSGKQGDSIQLVRARGNTYGQTKTVIGGSPTVAGASQIEDEMALSDQQRWMVPCHDCGEAHELQWENVHWLSDPEQNHPVFGTAKPETAYYACPHCGSIWDTARKNANSLVGRWVASAAFTGTRGFYYSCLMVTFGAGDLAKLATEYLQANRKFEEGEPGDLIAFWNTKLGRTWEHQSDTPDEETLKARAEDYAELTVPHGGLILTAGVDVQHDRLAVVIRAWGRGEESWLVYWGEIAGRTLVEEQGAWPDLDKLLTREFQHVSGAKLAIKAVSIDSSDGSVSEVVYAYVRRRLGRKYMAVKGAAEQSAERREIYTLPRAVDFKYRAKADKFGVQVYTVGTARAKDVLIENRINLTANGPGRIHWYAGVRPDYWEQLTSEMKVPHRTVKYRKVWHKKSGVRNEALDCEVYALHAARALKTNLMKDVHWGAIELKIRQQEIFAEPTDAPSEEPETAQAQEPAAAQARGGEVKPPPGPAVVVPRETSKQPPQRATQHRPPGFSVTNW
jgi:phage terminase large subunit GpA-like protein